LARTDRLEARLSPKERACIGQAAAVLGVSVAVFVVRAATERAEEIVAARMRTIVPEDYFESLLMSLDDPDAVPRLARAAKSARQAARIAAQ
jgi:uncharacterized protein (DUF1778 family)